MEPDEGVALGTAGKQQQQQKKPAAIVDRDFQTSLCWAAPVPECYIAGLLGIVAFPPQLDKIWYWWIQAGHCLPLRFGKIRYGLPPHHVVGVYLEAVVCCLFVGCLTSQQHAKSSGLLFVSWLLSIPATCKCVLGMDLLRQFYVLPHWDRSCRPNFPSHPVTEYWHRANQSQHWHYSARRLAG